MAIQRLLIGRGLVRSGSPLSLEGALEVADNVLIREPGVLGPRRGFDWDGGYLPVHPLTVVALFWFDGRRWFLSSTNILHREETGSWTAFTSNGWTFPGESASSITPPTGVTRHRIVESNRRLYLATKYGLLRLNRQDDFLVQHQPSLPQLDFDLSYAEESALGFLPANSACAYRAMLVARDKYGLEIQGPPSDRLVFRTLAAALDSAIGGLVRTGSLTVTVTTAAAHGLRPGQKVTLTPGEANFGAGSKTVLSVTGAMTFAYQDAGVDGASTLAQQFTLGKSKVNLRVNLDENYGERAIGGATHQPTILRVYRTRCTPTAADEPGEDYYLVYETEGFWQDYASIVDLTPDALLGLGGAAYFASSREGLGAVNGQAPAGKDLCEHDGRLYLANVTYAHALELQLISVEAFTAGMKLRITIPGAGGGGGDQHLDFSATLSIPSTYPANMEFYVQKTGNPISDIDITAQSLVNAINKAALNARIRARYLSTPDVMPGRFRIENVCPGMVAFRVSTDSSAITASFNPHVPSGFDTGNLYSTEETRPNRVHRSKANREDAFAPNDWAELGSGADGIERLVWLEDTGLAFRERSLWGLRESAGELSAEELERDFALLGRDTPAVLRDTCFALTTKGLYAVTALARERVTELDGILEPLIASARSQVAAQAYGLSYPAEDLYLLALPSSSSDTYPTQVLVYSARTRTFARWPMNAQLMAASPLDERLHLARPAAMRLSRERKSFTAEDLCDESESFRVSSVGAIEGGAFLVIDKPTNSHLDDANSRFHFRCDEADGTLYDLIENYQLPETGNVADNSIGSAPGKIGAYARRLLDDGNFGNGGCNAGALLSSSFASVNDFVLAFWLYVEANDAGGRDKRIFRLEKGGGFTLDGYVKNSGVLHNVWNAGGAYNLDTSGAITYSAWAHWQIVKRGTALELYQNGLIAAGVTVASYTGGAASTTTFQLGSIGSGAEASLKGRVDDVWARAGSWTGDDAYAEYQRAIATTLPANPKVGDMLVEADGQKALILTATDGGSTIIATFLAQVGASFAPGLYTLKPSFLSRARYHALAQREPDKLRKLSWLKALLRRKELWLGEVKLASDKSQTLAVAQSLRRTGYTPGAVLPSALPLNHRVLPHREKALGAYHSLELSVQEAEGLWELLGFAFEAELLEEREGTE